MEAGFKNKSFILEPDDSVSLRRGQLCPGICNREKKIEQYVGKVSYSLFGTFVANTVFKVIVDKIQPLQILDNRISKLQ